MKGDIIMAELPEIAKLSKQMHETLCGKTIKEIILLQDKCANVSKDEFLNRIKGAQIISVYNKGKWIIQTLSNGENILLSLGMGADVLYFENQQNEAQKYQIKLLFEDESGYTARFWWFGKYLLAFKDKMVEEPNTKDIAIDPFNEKFTLNYFLSLMKDKKTQVKAFLMDQKNVGGIGNMYMHDILFKANLHPLKKLIDVDIEDKEKLYFSIIDLLNYSKEKGAFAYESDFFGNKGGFTIDDFMIGYKEKQPCPVCGEQIISLKTGSTSSFICPICQKL